MRLLLLPVLALHLTAGAQNVSETKEGRAYMGCLLSQTQKLDDYISDARTVGGAAAEVCSREVIAAFSSVAPSASTDPDMRESVMDSARKLATTIVLQNRVERRKK